MPVRENETGAFDILDENGNIVATQKRKPRKGRPPRADGYQKGKPLKLTLGRQLKTVQLEDGREIMLPSGYVYPYSKEVADAICALIMEGLTMTEIAEMKGMPSIPIIYSWMRSREDFRADVRGARQMRGEYYHDLAVKTAMECEPETSRADKIKTETFKWAADRVEPKEAAKPTVAIQINTGVPRDKDPSD
jgi:hypothetical protein